MPENNNNNQPLDFAEKVLQSLKRASRAVDLNEPITPSYTVNSNEPIASSVNRDFTAYGAQEAGDPGPGSGGNKDIVIIPGFGGAAASSTSQVNFYWNAPAVPDSTGIDSNVRATIYNYAITQTRPTLVIGGYDGTNQYKPIANYGTGTGITAKIWFHPFLGRIDADQFGFNTLAATGVSTATGILTWDATQNKIRVGVAGTAKTLAYTDDISPFSGSATTASNLNLATSATQTSSHFLTMSASQTATGVAGAAISTVSTVFVVPNTGVVNAGGFSGNVTGTVSGNVTGNVSGSITGNVSGSLTGNVSGNLTGNVSGNVTGNVSGSVTGNLAGTALTAGATHTFATTSATAHYITFVPSSTTQTASGVGQSVVSSVSVVPSSGVITAGGFSGNVTGTVSGNVTGNVSGTVTGNVSGNVTGNVSGTVTGNVSGNLTGNVSGNVTGNVSGSVTGNLAGTALTAGSTHTFATTSATAHYITFVPSSTTQTASGVGQSVVSSVSVVPSSGVITAGGFSGNVTGTVSGNVTGNVSGTVTGNVSGTVTGNVSGSLTGNVSGNVTGNVSGTVTGNVSGTVTGNVSGNLTGNVSGNVTGNVSGSVTGNLAGTALTAGATHTFATTSATAHYITFVPSSTSQTASGVGQSVVSSVSVVPSSGVITAGGFSGNVTGTVSGNVTGNVSGNLTGNVSGSLTGNVSGNITGNVSGSVTGNVSGNVSGNLTGNVSGNVTGNVSGNLTGNVVGFATTAQNVNVLAADAATGNHFLPFVRTQTGSGLALSTDSTLYYDPANNILYSTNFNGAFTGTISGVASTAANMVVNNAAESTTHYILISPTPTGAGVAVSSDATFTINPSTNAMSMGSGNITVNNVTLGSAARTVSTSTGNLILDSSGGQVDIADNVVITGNLTVQGTTITVDSTVSTIVDPVIVVGSGVGGSHSTADNNMDRGIEFRWSTGAGNATTGFFGFSDTDSKFRFIPNATTVAGSNVYTGTVGTVVANLEGAHAGNVTGNVSGNLTGNVSGNVTGNVSGSVTGNLAGTALTAGATHTFATISATAHYITFVPSSSSQTASGVGQSVVSSVSVVPSSGVITAGGFSGNVTGTVSGNVTGNVSGTVTGNVSGTVTGNVSGTVTGNVSGSLTGNVSGNVTGNVSGNVTGNVSGSVTGNLAGTALTAGATHTFATTSATAHYITFVPSSTTQTASGVGQSVVSSVSVVPSSGVITAGGFSGNVTGTVSGNVTGNVSGTVTGNVSGTVTGNVSGSLTGNVSGNLTGNVSGTVTGNVSGSLTGNVSGNLTGNVSGNVTGSVSGSVTGNLAGTALTAGATHTFATTSATAHYITFVPSSTTQTASGVGQSVVSSVSVVPSSGVITAGGFSGNVTGTVSGNVTGNVSGTVTGNVSGNVTGNVSGTVTGNVSGNLTGNVSGTVTGNVSGNVTGNVSGSVTGNLAGTALTAGATHTFATTSATAHYITFVPSSTTQTASGVGQSVVSSVSVVPSSGVITAGGFSGNVTGTVSGNVTGNVSGTVTGNVSGTVTGNVSGSLTGNVSGNLTGNVSGTVTGNVSGSLTGNVSGNLTGNVSGSVTGNVSGNLTGSVSGTATTAQNLNVGSTAAATNYVLLSSSATGTGIAVSTKTSLAFNASTDTLTINNIVGSGSGLTISATTALTNNSYLTIQTVSGDDNSTSDFFIRGINSTATSKFSVDANGNLRATTKSFDIPHPTKEGKRLVYGVLEGPEHGVYHRGTVEGKGNILVELPEYWTKLVNEEYSIHLTSWGNYGVQILEKASSSFIISATGNPFTKKFKSIKVDYIVHGSRKDAHLDIEQD